MFEFNVGALTAGAGGTITFSIIVDNPLAAGIDDLVNDITIADDGTNGADEDPTDNSDSDIDTITAAPDLFVTKDDGNSVVIAGDTVTYTINYGNNGSQGATGVLLTETLPPGSTFNAAGSTAGWTETAPGSGVFEFNVAALAAGTGGTITFSVIVNDPLAAGIDQLVNNVTITDDGTNGADEDPSDNSDNDTDNINAAPDLYVSKDDGGANVTPGGIVSYTLNYGNDGSQDATNVVITELLPLSTTFDAAGSTVGWTETFPGSGIFEFVVGNVDAGTSGSVVFAVRVDPATLAGFIIDNTASIADDGTNGGDEDPTDNSDTDTTPVVDGIDLTITNDDGALTVLPGGTVIYTIDYSNVGTVDATGVVITETLPANSSFDPTNSTAGWVESAPGSGVYELTVGALNVGDTGSIAFAVIVDDPLVAGVDQLINDACDHGRRHERR